MWREYILSVVTVSLICSILRQILPDSQGNELLQILCGVVLVLAILRPITGIRSADLMRMLPSEMGSAEPYLADGKEAAAAVKKEYITDACEAYILNRAKDMGVEILPQVVLDDANLPVSVQIQGSVNPQSREVLERILADDLGITKENQQWTGNPESSG